MLSPRKIASIVLLAVGIVFVLVLLAGSWEQIATLLQSANWLLLSMSAVVGIATMVATSVFFRYLLIKHAMELPVGDVHKMFFYGQIAKYVPGKIWGILYQTASVNRKGAAQSIGAANFDLMIVSLITNFSIAVTLIAGQASVYLAMAMFFAGMYAAVFATRSAVAGKAIGWLVNKIGATPAQEGEIKFASEAGIVPVVNYYCLMWFAGLLAYYLMMHAVFSFTLAEVLAIVAYLILAWVVGVFAFVVPGGVGVRELVFIAFGTWMMPGVEVEMLATIALVSRFWQVLQELGAAAAVFLWGAAKAG